MAQGTLGIDTKAVTNRGATIRTAAASARNDSAGTLQSLLGAEASVSGDGTGIARFKAALENADRAAVRAWDAATSAIEAYGAHLVKAGTLFDVVDAAGGNTTDGELI